MAPETTASSADLSTVMVGAEPETSRTMSTCGVPSEESSARTSFAWWAETSTSSIVFPLEAVTLSNPAAWVGVTPLSPTR